MRTRIHSTIICMAIFLALPCVTEACLIDTIDIAHTDFGAYGPAQVWAAGFEGKLSSAGVYMLDKTAGTGDGNIWRNGQIPGFCMELEEVAPDDTHTYQVLMPEDAYNGFLGEQIGLVKADYLRELWGRFYDPAWAAGGPYTDQQNSNAEAFAVAIWEIIYEDLPISPTAWDAGADGTDGDRGFSAAGFDGGWKYTLSDILTANNWLHQLDGTGTKADLRALVYNGYQDYLVQVPEPASIILLGLGGVVSLMRKKKATS